MGRWESKERMAERRQRVAELKAQGLSHSTIAMRSGKMAQRLPSDNKIPEAQVKYYFILAQRMGIEAGYLWLYHNDFACRVPAEVRDKIARYEDSKKIRRPPWEK